MDAEAIADLWTRGDPALASAEKETTIRWAKPDDEAAIHTDERGPGRRLIQHPDSTVEALFVLRDDGARDVLEPEEVAEGDEVVGAKVRLPVAVLGVSGAPRASDQHAEVVTDRVLGDSTEEGEA